MEEVFVEEGRDASPEIKKQIIVLDSQLSRPVPSPSIGDHFEMALKKKWRQTNEEDIERIHHYQIIQAERIFGPVDLNILQTLSLFSFTYENIIGEIVGFLCLNAYPNIPALLPEVWIHWVKFHYSFTSLKYENTYFIHYLIWDMRYNADHLKNQFEQLFLDNPMLEYICIVLPPKSTFSNDYAYLLDKLFHRTLPNKNNGHQSSQCLYISNRSDILPTFRLRRAIPEDNDDLLAILNHTHPDFRNIYGEYYIAKTLLKKDKDTCIIVANIGVQIKGLIWLNSSVDVEKINENFHSLPYKFLRKHGPNTKTVQKKFVYIMRKYLKNYFQNISASLSDVHLRLNLEDIVKDEGIGNKFEVETIDTFDNFFSSDDALNQAPSEIYNDVDWLEIKEKLQFYSNFYKYGEKTVEEVENPPDAFAIQLIALHPDLDQRLAYQMLVAAFDAFPKTSYCFLSLPTEIPTPHIIRHFTKLAPRPECPIKECLYIVHKNVIRGKTTVHRVKGSDLKGIKSMLKYGTFQEIQPAREMMFFIRHALISQEKKYHALVVKNENKIIGIIILSMAEDINLFHKYYRLDDYACYRNLYLPQLHGKILYMYVNPIIEGVSANIFTNIYRITGYHSLYYTLQEPDLLNPYNNLVNQMYPVRPRKVLQDSKDKCEELKPYILFYHNIKLISEPRRNVDIKIAFVGFTRATKAFLEYIIYERSTQKYRFSNLNVIATPGVFEADYADMKGKTHLLWTKPKYKQNYLQRLGFMFWVNFLSGSIKEVNRKDKIITLKGGKVLTYDYLFLFENWEFGIPSNVPKEEVTEPLNFQSVNTNFDIHGLHYKIVALKKSKNKDISVIVYGNVLRAYACVNYLLECDIRPESIHFVTDIPGKVEKFGMDSQFGDEYVTNRVTEEIEKTNINIYKGYKFEKWIRDENDMIRKVCFVSKFRAMWLDCTFMICYIRKKMSRSLFEVLRQADLVIEGCTVIDSNFRTNDPYIYSCGSGTKYRRELYANKYMHVYYNHHEVAEYLAKMTIERVTEKIGNLAKPLGPQPHTPKRCNTTVPIFQKPILKSINLPGGLCLTSLREPGVRLPLRLRLLHSFSGKDLVTINRSASGSVSESYCRVRLDKFGFIRDITCLTNGDEDLEFLYRLYGHHESLLSNMKAKYDAGKIDDFLEFFRNTCTVTIADDRFQNFLSNTIAAEKRALHLIPEMHALLQQMAEGKRRNLTETERNFIKWMVNCKFKHLIEIKLFEYIKSDEDKFYMFATPEIVENELLKYGIDK